MGDVKWIKITTDIFDDEKLLLIEGLPDADAIVVIWFKLLCLAGKINNSGVFILNDKLAYTDSMLATIFRRKESTVKLALQTFEDLGMIERIEGVITIPNWNKHQNLDQLEKKKDYQREYMREYREKQKEIACKTNSKTNSKTNVSSIEREEEKEEDIEKEKRKEVKEKNSNFLKRSKQDDFNIDGLVDLYNSTCTKLSKLRAITDKRKESARKIYKKYGLDTIKEAFEMVNESAFLTGDNDRGWKANFDFIMREDKFIAILEGKYSSKKKSNRKHFGEEDDEQFGYQRKEKLNARKSY